MAAPFVQLLFPPGRLFEGTGFVPLFANPFGGFGVRVDFKVGFGGHFWELKEVFGIFHVSSVWPMESAIKYFLQKDEKREALSETSPSPQPSPALGRGCWKGDPALVQCQREAFGGAAGFEGIGSGRGGEACSRGL